MLELVRIRHCQVAVGIDARHQSCITQRGLYELFIIQGLLLLPLFEMPADHPCPCGRLDARRRPLPYDRCCGPCHAGLPPPDAETLMRSRYSAFVRGDDVYLRATWLPSTCPADLTLEPGVKWLGLEVRSHSVLDDTHAEVEFVARSRLDGRGQRLHERSRFVKQAGRWLYVDGDLF